MVIDFRPDVQRTLLPVNITEDDVLEQMEHFLLTLAVPDNAPPYLMGTTAATVLPLQFLKSRKNYLTLYWLLCKLIISLQTGDKYSILSNSHSLPILAMSPWCDRLAGVSHS